MTIPKFCNELASITWNVQHPMKMVFLLLRSLKNHFSAYDLDEKGCYFYKGHFSVAQRFRMSNLKTARLMNCSGHIIPSTCLKWMNNCEIISRSHRIERHDIIK